ncbi:MAG: monovalent cation/H+ antiporter subunit D family protein [Gammaproteobacteria bacterium]
MSLTAQLPALQVVVPMLTALLVAFLRLPGLAWTATTAASAMAFAIAVMLTQAVLPGAQIDYAMGGWAAPYGIALNLDAFSVLLLLIVSGASTVALLAGKASLDKEIDPSRQPMFFAGWLLVLAGLAGIVVTGDAFNIFVFMEISSLATYMLVAGGPDRRALTSVFKYLIMGTTGATFYLIGIGLIYMMTGTLNLADMEARIGEVQDVKPILVAAGFITIGLALKAAVFPLHAWLPNAYTYAPNVVTVFLAACSTKVALYVLLRFDFLVFQGNLSQHDLQFAGFLIPLALLGIVMGSLAAVFERNLKRLLAYSSVAQIGYILLGAGCVSVLGLTAGIVHMFNHALAKGALFLAVACLGMSLARLRITDLAGIGRHMPWTMGAFVLAGLSLIGVPGTAGFISKWYLILASLEQGPIGLLMVAVIVASSLLAVVYVWRIVEIACFGERKAGASAIGEAPLSMLLVTWVVALANLFFGLRPDLPVELATSAARVLLGQLL